MTNFAQRQCGLKMEGLRLIICVRLNNLIWYICRHSFDLNSLNTIQDKF
jgi:hypothetical protein